MGWLALALLLLGGGGYLGWTLVGEGAGDARVVEERAPAEASLEARHAGDEDPATGSSEADAVPAATSKTRELVADDAPFEQAPPERAPVEQVADEGTRTSQHDDPDPDDAEPPGSVQERAPRGRPQASRGLSPEAREKLEEAEAALAEGDAGGATRLGRASLRIQRSQRARAVLAKAACLRRDIGLANAMARGVRGKPRREAARFCKAQGITLR